jgi:hypothetical protein
MTLSECVYGEGSPGHHVASNGNGGRGLSVIEELVDSISDVIYGLASRRPDSSDGVAWLSFDAALCGLHSALVALEEFGGVHKLDQLPSIPANWH